MRDVLGGMEELALMKGYQPGTDLMEIVAIEPGESSTKRAPPAASAHIVPFDRRRRHNA